MKALRLPTWLRRDVLAPYHAGAARLFVLHGATHDLHPCGDAFLPIPDVLRALLARRPDTLVVDASARPRPASAVVLSEFDRLATFLEAAPHALVIVVARDPAAIPAQIVATRVAVPLPDEELRAAYLDHLARGSGGVRAADVAVLARETGGLPLQRLRELAARAAADGGTFGPETLQQNRLAVLRAEYGDVLEIVEPRHGLEAVGGLAEARHELSAIAALLRRGERIAVPQGVMLMGPPGTGKSFLAECFAHDCGLLAVRFRPLRDMYQGQSERNQERAFAAIRALAPVVVIVDEADEAEGGGDREQGDGDGGVGSRMRGAALAFWGDGTLRGRVLRLDITNRPDRIDAALRRSGRTDVKIPILMPDGPARAQILASAVRRHRIPAAEIDWRRFARRGVGFTGSDLELAVSTAYRFAREAGEDMLTAARLEAAFDDLLPAQRDQRTIDRMTVLALDECRQKRLLPRGHERIRKAAEERLAQRS